MRPLTHLLRGVVFAYRYTLSPYLGQRCRFVPSCSRYALDALDMHGPWRGGWLTLRRVLRCNPFGDWGYDPVPVPKSHDHGSQSSGCDHGMRDNAPVRRL